MMQKAIEQLCAARERAEYLARLRPSEAASELLPPEISLQDWTRRAEPPKENRFNLPERGGAAPPV